MKLIALADTYKLSCSALIKKLIDERFNELSGDSITDKVFRLHKELNPQLWEEIRNGNKK